MPLLPQLSSDSLKDTPWPLLYRGQDNHDMLPGLAVSNLLPLFLKWPFLVLSS